VQLHNVRKLGARLGGLDRVFPSLAAFTISLAAIALSHWCRPSRAETCHSCRLSPIGRELDADLGCPELIATTEDIKVELHHSQICTARVEGRTHA
jgi:hypothetical protein